MKTKKRKKSLAFIANQEKIYCQPRKNELSQKDYLRAFVLAFYVIIPLLYFDDVSVKMKYDEIFPNSKC